MTPERWAEDARVHHDRHKWSGAAVSVPSTEASEEVLGDQLLPLAASLAS